MHIPTVQEKTKFWVLGSWERGLSLFLFLISKIKWQLLQYAPSDILLLSVIFSTRREIKWNPGLFQTVLNFLLLTSAIRLRLTQLDGSLEKVGSPLRAPRQLIPPPVHCLIGKLNIGTAKVNTAINTASLLLDITRFSEVCFVLNFTYANSVLRVAQHLYSLCGVTGLCRFPGCFGSLFLFISLGLLEINLNWFNILHSFTRRRVERRPFLSLYLLQIFTLKKLAWYNWLDARYWWFPHFYSFL